MKVDTWKKYIMESLYYAMRVFPIRRNRIVFTSYFGKGYGDNGKYIAEALLKSGEDYDIVWLVKDTSQEFPEGIRAVNYYSPQGVYEMATARIWVDNSRKPAYVRKRKGQYYIQTWHGGIGFKKVEKDAGDALSDAYVNAAIRDSQMADLFTSDSEWLTSLYRHTFWYQGKVSKFGLPREDVFFAPEKADTTEIRKKLNLKEDVKVLLYAPTFRKGKTEDMLDIYDLGWEQVLNAYRERFGGEWVGMIRLHPLITELADKLDLPDGVMNVTNYPDMQELLLISDSLISDFSSCVFDLAIARKPVFMFAKDIADYMDDRGLYFRFDELPFALSENTQQLAESIRTFDEKRYRDSLDTFLVDRCGLYNGGHASEKIAEIIRRRVYGKR